MIDKPVGLLVSHRVPAHLARRFHQICLGVTAPILDEIGLNQQQWGVMAVISEEPGSGQRHLARRTGIDEVTIGQTVDLLEKNGLAERKIDPEDRRARRLFLTARGSDLRRRLRPILVALQERLLAPLTKVERAQLIDMLVRVIEANEAYARPGNGRRKPRRRSASLLSV